MVFQAVFFFLQKSCTHFSSPPCLPHVLTVSFPFILSPNIILWRAKALKPLIVHFFHLSLFFLLCPNIRLSSLYSNTVPTTTRIPYSSATNDKILRAFGYINQRPVFLCIYLKLPITIITSIVLLL